MKKFYKSIMIILHCVGLVFISAVSFSRVCFYATWPPKDDIILWLMVIIVFFSHYSLLLLGYKLKYFSLDFFHIFKIAEIIYSSSQLAIIVLLCLVTWFNLSFSAIFPLIATPVIALALRAVAKKTIRDRGT